ncbi:MAG: hypothetical protein TRG1_513 [Flavobacteriaceae bacterium FS1-H7996/R]|nr:MAG: hypothetical protein TRG1_513 [Flavobacteriaceae bacterium FS1-H7996/R]
MRILVIFLYSPVITTLKGNFNPELQISTLTQSNGKPYL